MRRSVALLVAITGFCSLGGASTAADVDWTSLPYFDALGMRAQLSADSTWSGSKAVDAANFNLQPSTSWPKVRRQWIWAPTCSRPRSASCLSKTFLVPGEPLDGTLSFNYGPGNQYYGGRPYVSGSFLVNSVEIGKLGDIAHFPRKAQPWLTKKLNAHDRKAFRYGANTLTIRVERAALKKGERCTRPAATSGGNVRYIAIGSDLSLDFGGDLQAVPPAAAQQVQEERQERRHDLARRHGRLPERRPLGGIEGALLVTVSGDGFAADSSRP